MDSATQSVSLVLEITEEGAAHLCSARMARSVFHLEDLPRFEHLLEDADLNDSRFDLGHFAWCATYSDALLWRAYERACGHDTLILWDLAFAGEQDAWVVLTSRILFPE